MNVKLLENKINEKGYQKQYIARVLNMTPSSFSYKLSGGSKFSLEQVRKISEVLDLSPDDIQAIFFTN